MKSEYQTPHPDPHVYDRKQTWVGSYRDLISTIWVYSRGQMKSNQVSVLHPTRPDFTWTKLHCS